MSTATPAALLGRRHQIRHTIGRESLEVVFSRRMRGYHCAMRLSPHQCRIIRQTLEGHFGRSSLIRLFGSRVDDTARGGDIDLYIEPEIQDPDELVDARLNALAELHRVLGDQKIDIVIRRAGGADLPIHQYARETGIQL